jgi:serine/threonine protein kinase
MSLPERIGRYDVERLLGEGGMGRVYLARDTVLGRYVALKVLRDDLGLTPELKSQLYERMRQEARAAAALSHPAMVTLHDMGEDETVGLYLVFERIDGPTLRERLETGPIPPQDVAAIARALGAALTHAHAAGVVHRDVKPENVMLPPAGAKLTDFGIARLPDSTLTRATTVLGTPAYSAPEALASSKFGPASDEFSLAATLYEALTGKRAFLGDDALQVAARVATGKQAALASFGGLRPFVHLDRIFDRALAKEPRNRFATCESFGTALAAELESGGSAFLATPVPFRSSIVPRATRRWQNVVALAAVVVIVALVLVGRQAQPDGEGVSLKEVANAFASAVEGNRAGAASMSPSHRPHAPPIPSASSSGTPAASAASSASAQAETPAPPPSASAPPSPSSSSSQEAGSLEPGARPGAPPP